MPLHPKIQVALQKSQVLKLIVGLDNFNLTEVIKKVQAAELGEATYIDIAANIDILRKIQKVSSLPICVSSIDIDKLYECYKEGADILEISNFDIFYKKRIFFSEHQILQLAKELRIKTPGSIICVTIPHNLEFNVQIKLAQKLEKLGINLIQTEGIRIKFSILNYLDQSIYNASSALSCTYVFSKYINIPIISSSGINSLNTPMAMSYGAFGVGIGSFFNLFSNSLDISNNIYAIIYMIRRNQAINQIAEDLYFNYLSIRRNYLDKVRYVHKQLNNPAHITLS